MANRAYLYVGDEAGAPGGRDEQVLGASYLVPVLWLSILEQEELRRVVETSGDGEATWHFSIQADEALRRCERRTEALRACVSNVDAYLPAWLDLLRSLAGRHVKIDPTEVLWMADSEPAAVAELQKALTFLDAPSPESTAAFLAVTCLGDVYDADSQEVRDTPGQQASAALGEAGVTLRETGERRLPDHRARDYLVGYPIADWVRWDPAGERERPRPAKAAPPARSRRLAWHPVSPLAALAVFLWFGRSSAWTWLRILGGAVLGLWLVLSVFDVVSKGAFTAWLDRDG